MDNLIFSNFLYSLCKYSLVHFQRGLYHSFFITQPQWTDLPLSSLIPQALQLGPLSFFSIPSHPTSVYLASNKSILTSLKSSEHAAFCLVVISDKYPLDSLFNSLELVSYGGTCLLPNDTLVPEMETSGPLPGLISFIMIIDT